MGQKIRYQAASEACCFSSCNSGVPWPFRLVADVGKKLCKRIVERVGSRSFTASLVTLWQSLCGVIRLKREVDAWDQQRCLALIPYPEEVSDFRGFRPVSALLQESAGLRFQVGLLHDLLNDRLLKPEIHVLKNRSFCCYLSVIFQGCALVNS